MPRSIASRKLGGLSNARRKRYTAKEKLKLLSELEDMRLNQGLSLRSAAKTLQVACSLLCRWARSRAAFDALSKRWRKKKLLIEGPTGTLDPVKDALLSWVFELRERGHAVDRSMVVTKA